MSTPFDSLNEDFLPGQRICNYVDTVQITFTGVVAAATGWYGGFCYVLAVDDSEGVSAPYTIFKAKYNRYVSTSLTTKVRTADFGIAAAMLAKYEERRLPLKVDL